MSDMTGKLYRLHGLLIIDVTYETRADVPPEFAGREVEYLEELGFPEVVTLSTNSGVVGLSGQMPKWNVDDAKFSVCMAEEVKP